MRSLGDKELKRLELRLDWNWVTGKQGSGELRKIARPDLLHDEGVEYLFAKTPTGEHVRAAKLLPALRRRSADYCRAGQSNPGMRAVAELVLDHRAIQNVGG